jgi:hypothetical protein
MKSLQAKFGPIQNDVHERLAERSHFREGATCEFNVMDVDRQQPAMVELSSAVFSFLGAEWGRNSSMGIDENNV